MTNIPEPDRLVLEELRKRGDVALIPRPIYIWIYGDEEDLVTVSARLRERGWEDVEPEPRQKSWVIRAERLQATTESDITAMVDEISTALDGTEANFDGWETSVERSN